MPDYAYNFVMGFREKDETVFSYDLHAGLFKHYLKNSMLSM
jgi:hypothetical protein